MSHFMAYRGPEVLLSNLLHIPENSMICETDNDKKSSINTDGFGIGWYNKSIHLRPAIYKTIRSPLFDDNLNSISESIQSNCVFIHQLNIDDSYSAQQINCQPFTYNALMFMHIGSLSAFHLIKKDIIKKIEPKAFDAIRGHSVSEYIFAFYLSQLNLNKENYTQMELENALLATKEKLTLMCRKVDRRYHLSLNIAVTDSDHFAAMRYMDDFTKKPDPLYYTFGDKLYIKDKNLEIQKKSVRHKFVMLSSKKLDIKNVEWFEVPENHLVNISSLNNVSFKEII